MPFCAGRYVFTDYRAEEGLLWHLDNWNSVSFEDRRLVLDRLVTTIRATSENIRIEWKI
ncbi:MAG: hypothetical protein LBL15_00865 [Oscillospiraceae bacterium]|jgi:hypothetical protein|nr:hypothetical protein [Oscillospiraceae bacterium]